MPYGPIGSTGPIGAKCLNELSSTGPIGAICLNELMPIGPIGSIGPIGAICPIDANRPYSCGTMNKLSCASHVMLLQKAPQKRGVTYSQNGF